MLLVLAGLLALLGINTDPARADRFLLVAVCDFALALVALLPPWERTRPNAPAWLGLPSFAVLGLSTWSFGGSASGTGPFLVLIYAWAALHFPRWILLGYVVPATLAYLVPLVVTDQPPLVLSSALILMPVAIAVALLIEAQARHQRDDHERLARIEQWRSAMMSTLAHDVRTPLNTVQMVLEEVRAEAPPPVARLVDSALRQTARITQLAEGLLDVQRIDRDGRLQLDLREHPARTLVKEALTYVRSTDTNVTLDIDDAQTLYVDRQRFEQILVNLLTNAMRYGAPPVVVSIVSDHGQDRLEVRDHGPGIPDHLRERLFEQFAAGGAQGIGLGLWIVRQLAAAHGGRASAEARDPGVAMVVTFPSLDSDREHRDT